MVKTLTKAMHAVQPNDNLQNHCTKGWCDHFFENCKYKPLRVNDVRRQESLATLIAFYKTEKEGFGKALIYQLGLSGYAFVGTSRSIQRHYPIELYLQDYV